jgi:hypothetical protein
MRTAYGVADGADAHCLTKEFGANRLENGYGPTGECTVTVPSTEPTPAALNRPRSLLIASGLLLSSAILMVIGKRGVFDGVANQWSEVASLLIGVWGFLYLIYIWRANRFRVSIGRLMIVTAIIAVLFQGTRMYVNWLKGV